VGRRVIDLAGRTFAHLTVLSRHGQVSRSDSAHWLCQCTCGKTRVVASGRLRDGSTKSCGCLNFKLHDRRVHGGRGPANPNWGGGRSVTDEGYVLLYRPEHPHADTHGYVREHRLVMEKQLGRYLTEDETVHHKFGNRADNRPERLELWSTAHPAGERVEDLVAFAKEILRKYDGVVVEIGA